MLAEREGMVHTVYHISPNSLNIFYLCAFHFSIIGSLTTTMWRRLFPFPSDHSSHHSPRTASSLSQRVEVCLVGVALSMSLVRWLNWSEGCACVCSNLNG